MKKLIAIFYIYTFLNTNLCLSSDTVKLNDLLLPSLDEAFEWVTNPEILKDIVQDVLANKDSFEYLLDYSKLNLFFKNICSDTNLINSDVDIKKYCETNDYLKYSSLFTSKSEYKTKVALAIHRGIFIQKILSTVENYSGEKDAINELLLMLQPRLVTEKNLYLWSYMLGRNVEKIVNDTNVPKNKQIEQIYESKIFNTPIDKLILSNQELVPNTMIDDEEAKIFVENQTAGQEQDDRHFVATNFLYQINQNIPNIALFLDEKKQVEYEFLNKTCYNVSGIKIDIDRLKKQCPVLYANWDNFNRKTSSLIDKIKSRDNQTIKDLVNYMFFYELESIYNKQNLKLINAEERIRDIITLSDFDYVQKYSTLDDDTINQHLYNEYVQEHKTSSDKFVKGQLETSVSNLQNNLKINQQEHHKQLILEINKDIYDYKKDLLKKQNQNISYAWEYRWLPKAGLESLYPKEGELAYIPLCLTEPDLPKKLPKGISKNSNGQYIDQFGFVLQGADLNIIKNCISGSKDGDRRNFPGLPYKGKDFLIKILDVLNIEKSEIFYDFVKDMADPNNWNAYPNSYLHRKTSRELIAQSMLYSWMGLTDFDKINEYRRAKLTEDEKTFIQEGLLIMQSKHPELIGQGAIYKNEVNQIMDTLFRINQQQIELSSDAIMQYMMKAPVVTAVAAISAVYATPASVPALLTSNVTKALLSDTGRVVTNLAFTVGFSKGLTDIRKQQMEKNPLYSSLSHLEKYIMAFHQTGSDVIFYSMPIAPNIGFINNALITSGGTFNKIFWQQLKSTVKNNAVQGLTSKSVLAESTALLSVGQKGRASWMLTKDIAKTIGFNIGGEALAFALYMQVVDAAIETQIRDGVKVDKFLDRFVKGIKDLPSHVVDAFLFMSFLRLNGAVLGKNPVLVKSFQNIVSLDIGLSAISSSTGAVIAWQNQDMDSYIENLKSATKSTMFLMGPIANQFRQLSINIYNNLNSASKNITRIEAIKRARKDKFDNFLFEHLYVKGKDAANAHPMSKLNRQETPIQRDNFFKEAIASIIKNNPFALRTEISEKMSKISDIDYYDYRPGSKRIDPSIKAVNIFGKMSNLQKSYSTDLPIKLVDGNVIRTKIGSVYDAYAPKSKAFFITYTLKEGNTKIEITRTSTTRLDGVIVAKAKFTEYVDGKLIRERQIDIKKFEKFFKAQKELKEACM